MTVDATLIAALPSTKRREGKRDPEVTQTKKGNQWYFGMKAHIGVDDESGLVHSLIGTTTKVSNMSQFTQLLHGEEERVSADRGYEYPQIHGHLQENLIEDWVALKGKPGKGLSAWAQGLNHAIAQVRAIGEHQFRILKRQFGYTQVRYRGLAKNTAQFFTLFALGNLFQVRRALLAETDAHPLSRHCYPWHYPAILKAQNPAAPRPGLRHGNRRAYLATA